MVVRGRGLRSESGQASDQSRSDLIQHRPGPETVGVGGPVGPTLESGGVGCWGIVRGEHVNALDFGAGAHPWPEDWLRNMPVLPRQEALLVCMCSECDRDPQSRADVGGLDEDGVDGHVPVRKRLQRSG